MPRITSAVLVGLLLAACGPLGRAGEDAPAASPTATVARTAAPPAATPTPVPTFFPTTPGVPLELNPIINAVLSSDVDTLVRLSRFAQVECGPQLGPGSPPPCPPGVLPGTRVEVFPVATCEGEFRAPEALRPTYEQLVSATNKVLVGVFEAPRPYLPRASSDYVAVFSRDVGDQVGLGVGVAVNNDRISGIWFGCNVPPTGIVPKDADALWLRGQS